MYISATEKAIAANSGLTVGNLEVFAEISDLHGHVADAVIDAARLIAHIEHDLRAKISAARRDLDRADAALMAGEAINERGVLQYTATEVDMLAARRADAYGRLAAVCRIATAPPAPATITRT